MSILTKEKILSEIKKGNITIEPFDKSCLGPGSYDLHLSNEFRIFNRSKRVFDINDASDYEDITRKKAMDKITLKPNETILGITKEKITLSESICGWLEGRSRFARLGLLVHISSSFMQPGISNRQVLEISNMSQVPLAIKSGTRICQFVFERTEGKAKYAGKFKQQSL